MSLKKLNISKNTLINKYIAEFDNIVVECKDNKVKTKLELTLIDILLPELLEIVESESKYINKHIKKLKIKYASVDDKNRLIIDKESQNYIYTKEDALSLDEEIENLYSENVCLDIDDTTFEILKNGIEEIESIRIKLFLKQLLKNIS